MVSRKSFWGIVLKKAEPLEHGILHVILQGPLHLPPPCPDTPEKVAKTLKKGRIKRVFTGAIQHLSGALAARCYFRFCLLSQSVGFKML